jgi:hypothetical protein
VEKSKNKKLDGAKRKLQEECGIYMYSKITRGMYVVCCPFSRHLPVQEVVSYGINFI